MKRSRILLFTVVYPGVENYLKDFFNSIHNQDDQNYDLLIFNDGISESLIKKLCKHKNTYCLVNDCGYSIAQVRNQGIEYAIANEYETIVFADSDDYFSKNRISQIRKNINFYDVLFSELTLVSDNNVILESDLFASGKFNSFLEGVEALVDCNVVGMSHSAVKVECLKHLVIGQNLQAVDWFLFSVLMLNHRSFGFLGTVQTFYRQHGNNLVGADKYLSEKRLKKGIEIKKNHYGCLLSYCDDKRLFEYAKLFKVKLEQMFELETKLRDRIYLNRYIDTINRNFVEIYNGWWSEILPIQSMEKYV